MSRLSLSYPVAASVVFTLVGTLAAEEYDAAGEIVLASPEAQAPALDDQFDSDSGHSWNWIAGVEATYLRPEFLGDNNVSFENDVTFDSADFDYDYGAAPRAWIGLENPNGWGARARYWDFTSTAPVNFYNSDIFIFRSVDGVSSVNAFAIDLELTKRLCTPNWILLGGFGARHAEIAHDEQLTVLDNLTLGHLAIGRQTRGSGLTGVLEASRPIGNRGFSLYGNARGSVLWGNTDLIDTVYLIPLGQGGGVLSQFLTEDVDETLSIFETQAGLEWSHDLAWCRGLLFARALVEYQIWTTDEDRIQSITNTSDNFTLTGVNATSDTAFYGLTFTIGFAH